MRIKKRNENIVRRYDTVKLKPESETSYAIFGHIGTNRHLIARFTDESQAKPLFNLIAYSERNFIVVDS